MATIMDDGTGGAQRIHALSKRRIEWVRSALHTGSGEKFDRDAMLDAISRYEIGDYSFERLIVDHSKQALNFNVMPGRNVSETLAPRCYFAGQDIARAVFDRSYETDMEESPSHLIFMSALVQWQKLIYLMVCHRLGVPYEADGPEAFKIWPTEVRCRMPTMVRDETNLIQDTFASRFDEIGDGVWSVEGFSVAHSRIGLIGKAMVYRIR